MAGQQAKLRLTGPVRVSRPHRVLSGRRGTGEELFARILSRSGTPFSTHTYDEVWDLVKRDRIQLAVPQLLGWLGELDPAAERPDPRYPYSLINGQRRSHNANQILRPPVVTSVGRIVVRAEVDESQRPMQIALPRGYGMSYPGGRGGRVTNGPRINLITDAADRDPIAGTPHHKDVPVRLEPATVEERVSAERDSALVLEVVNAARR